MLDLGGGVEGRIGRMGVWHGGGLQAGCACSCSQRRRRQGARWLGRARKSHGAVDLGRRSGADCWACPGVLRQPMATPRLTGPPRPRNRGTIAGVTASTAPAAASRRIAGPFERTGDPSRQKCRRDSHARPRSSEAERAPRTAELAAENTHRFRASQLHLCQLHHESTSSLLRDLHLAPAISRTGRAACAWLVEHAIQVLARCKSMSPIATVEARAEADLGVSRSFRVPAVP